MEFDEIKKAWKDSFNKKGHLNKEEIEAKLTIKKKSNTALNKIKRNYKIDLYVGTILSIAILWWIFNDITSEYKIYILLFTTTFFSTLILWETYNYLKVRKTVMSTNKLKPALIKTIKDIERYVNFNKSTFSKYLILPFSILLGLCLGILRKLGDDKINEIYNLLTIHQIISLSIVAIASCAIFIPITQFYNKKMFKQHLDELKECLEEFYDIEN